MKRLGDRQNFGSASLTRGSAIRCPHELEDRQVQWGWERARVLEGGSNVWDKAKRLTPSQVLPLVVLEETVPVRDGLAGHDGRSLHVANREYFCKECALESWLGNFRQEAPRSRFGHQWLTRTMPAISVNPASLCSTMDISQDLWAEASSPPS
jgi:hypothetical protein